MSVRKTLLLSFALVIAPSAARADDWPQWMGPGRDGVWHETGILEKFPAGGPKVRTAAWLTPCMPLPSLSAPRLR